MQNDIIDKIVQAEMKADELVKNAEKQAKELLLKEEQSGKTLELNSTKTNKEKTEDELRIFEADLEKKYDDDLKQASKTAETLVKKAKTHFDDMAKIIALEVKNGG